MKFAMGPHKWEETIADITAAGHELVELEEAEAYFNTSQNPAKFPQLPDNIRWVQHCYAGVNGFIDHGILTADGIPWANAAGAFALPVAESALALLLSQAHNHKAFALAASWSVAREVDSSQRWLYSPREPKRVLIVGAGGIGKQLIKLMEPFGVHVTAVTRSGREVPGAQENVAMVDVDQHWGQADFVVSILPLTEETAGVIDAKVFAAMKETAVFVNVGRGATVVTDDLVEALRTGQISGAGLDVMDPEPLPDGHPLYALPNATLTPHQAASSPVAKMHMGAVFNANAEAFAQGRRMPTQVDVDAGY